jgi:Tol biopolymer transport system component
MSRFSVLLLGALAASACAGDPAPRVPVQTDLLGATGGLPGTPALSPDGSRLAWSQPVDGQARIFVGASDASNPVRLSGGTWDFAPIWSPDGRWIAFAGESPEFDLWVVGSDGGEPRQLTSGPARDEPTGWLPDGTGIVFRRVGAGEARTMVAPVDGGPIRPLVAPLGGSQFVSLSPDGSRAAVELRRGSSTTLWLQDMAGGEARQLTTEGFEEGLPVRKMWSPDGRQLVYASRRTGTFDLWTANVETGELRQITNDVRNDTEHAWSPDGKWIAFSSDRGGQLDIWIVSAEGGEAIRVTDDLALESDLGWHPDGSALYFARAETDGGIGVTVPGGEPRMLVLWPGYLVNQPAVALSPDERTVLFVGNRSGSSDIWSVPLAGGEAVPFAAGALEELDPQFSPDGSQVLFSSNRTGAYDLWVMPAAGGEARRLTEWTSNEEHARWSPDGSQIAFVSDRETTQSDVWVIPAAGGTARRVTSFNQDVGTAPAWSPDGRHLYVALNSERGSQLYRVPVGGGRPQALQLSSATAIVGTGRPLAPDGAWYAYSVVVGGWAFREITPTAGGAPRRITRATEKVWHPLSVWSPDGSRLAVPDWQFGDDATTNVMELSVGDTTTRVLTTRARSFESPEMYTRDGRVVFSVVGAAATIVKVSVAELLAGR